MIFDRAILLLYNAFLLLFSPVLLLKKAIKFGRRGHSHEWDMERWKALLQVEGEGLRVVMVALSWGEVGILNEISRRLDSELPNLKVIWSIRDKSAQKMARAAFEQRSVVPMPFDFLVPALHWLEQVKPDVLIIVEKFWWPNLVWGAKLRGAKVVLVNGRSRGREKTRYKWIAAFQTWTLRAFDSLIFESPAQIERVRAVLPRGAKVRATGNIKFAFKTPSPPPEADDLTRWLQQRASNSEGPLPLLIAGSTSPIDDEWALQAWEAVRETVPCALLIAPRRLERSRELVKKLRERNWNVSLRSNPTSGTEILILDSLGELAYVYRFGVAAYVGGSVEGRGHNIIEPLAWGIPVGYGPIRGDFEGAQNAAEEWGVGFRLNLQNELADFWKKSLRDDEFGRAVSVNAQKLIVAQQGALEATVAAIASVLK